MVVDLDPRVADAAARLGQVLKDKWRLDDLLGVGGMAAVYAATHRNGKRVAIKMLHREYSLDGEVKTRFLREGYLVNKVEHPGVVGVLDDDASDDGAAFLVMDLLEGESLEARRLRKGGFLPPAEVLSVADQVLDILTAAHAVGMVHRDLKPENLFLCKDGTVKLLDFGIARLRELSARIGSTMNGGTTMGTPAFMPPEQARGNWTGVDARTDLWALGATMFTMLTGRIVHEASNIGDLLIHAMMRHADPLAAVMPDAPAKLGAVVDRALRYDQDDRWPDARSMQIGVREAYREVVGRPQAEPLPLAVSVVDQQQPAAVAAAVASAAASAVTALAPVPVSGVPDSLDPISDHETEPRGRFVRANGPAPSGGVVPSKTAAMPATPSAVPSHAPHSRHAPPQGAQHAPVGPSFGPPPAGPADAFGPAPGTSSSALPFVAVPPPRPVAHAALLLAAGVFLAALLGVLGIALVAELRGGAPAPAPSASGSVSAAPRASGAPGASGSAAAKSPDGR